MKKINYQIAFAAVAAWLFSVNCFAGQPSFTSHCNPKEAVFLSAKMKYVITNQDAIRLKDSGKILSLCAETRVNHVTKLTYRFGRIGDVELEKAATTTRRFGTFNRQPVPRVGEDIYFFNKGKYTYYIIVAGGMGSGISLIGYRDDKKVVDMFSGNDTDIDYYLGRLINANSVLVQQKPKHFFD